MGFLGTRSMVEGLGPRAGQATATDLSAGQNCRSTEKPYVCGAAADYDHCRSVGFLGTRSMVEGLGRWGSASASGVQRKRLLLRIKVIFSLLS